MTIYEKITEMVDRAAPASAPGVSSWKRLTNIKPAPPRWVIKYILPETGAGILAGQWGAFKTTIALEASVSVMAGLPFADRYKVKRRGAVLFIALEGEGMLSARLMDIAERRGISDPLALAFMWRGDCPALTDKNAANILCRIADEAAAELKREFNLPVVLIWIDTLVAAAGYAAGEENDSSASQQVMNVLRATSQHTGALVIGIDHFGKVVETGTRGSSAKEGAADVVIAVLADRELSGGVKNTRLAVRKLRDGRSGFEIPFRATIVETGDDEDGDPITAAVIDWQAAQQPVQADTRWPPSIQLLRRILMTILADAGRSVTPFADGSEVRGCDIEPVRTEFHRQYPADGTDKQKSETRRKAFTRAVKDSVARGLVATREVDNVQLVWLAKPEAANGRDSGT
jgi:hypothetical protein